MKTKISIPVETLHLLPYDREFSKAEAMIQVVYDIETQSEWSSEGYSKQFGWSRTKVENFLEKKTSKGSLKEQLERHRKLTNRAPLRDIKDRRDAFYWACSKYVEKYGKENIRNFFDYWTESDGKRMRFEDEKYFDIGRRLVTANRLIFNANGQQDKNMSAKLARIEEFEKLRAMTWAYPDDAAVFVKMKSMYKQEWLDEIVDEYGVENLTGNFSGYKKRKKS